MVLFPSLLETSETKDRKRLFRLSFVFFVFLLGGWCISFFTHYDYLYTFAIIASLFLIALVFYKPDAALVLLLVGMYFQDSPLEFVSVAIPVLTMVLLILFPVIWLLKRSQEGIMRIRLNYFAFPGRFLYFFVVIFILSTLHAESPGKTFVRGVAILLVSIFLVTLNDYFRNQRRIYVFVRSLCLVGGLLALYGLLQWLVVRKQMYGFLKPFIVPLSWQDVALKVGWKTSDLGQFKCRAVFHHQNIYGAVIASIAPLSLAMFFFHKKKWPKAFYGSVFLALSLALLLASSRGGLLNYMVACGIIFLIVRPKHLWKMIFAGTMSVAAFLFIYLEKIMFYLRLKSGLSGREQIWDYSLLMIEKSPWLGVGFLNMGEEFYNRFGPAYITDMIIFFDRIQYATGKIGFETFHAHNLYLNLAVEMGIFTAVAAFIFYIFMIYRLIRFIRKEKLRRWEKLIMIAMLGIFCGSFVHSFFDTNTVHYLFVHSVVIMGVERMYIVRLIEQAKV